MTASTPFLRFSIAAAALLLTAACTDVQIVSGDGDGGSMDDTSTSSGRPAPPAATPPVDIEPPPNARRAFVTSTSFDGDLGGVTGADELCAAAAEDAGLSGSWLAWLGTNTISPSARFIHLTTPYVRLDGVTIAESWADLTDGDLAAPISIDETGAPIPSSGNKVWTAADAAGLFAFGGTCADWTEANSGGFFGDPNAVDAAWAHVSCQPCTETARLYCFEE